MAFREMESHAQSGTFIFFVIYLFALVKYSRHCSKHLPNISSFNPYYSLEVGGIHSKDTE